MKKVIRAVKNALYTHRAKIETNKTPVYLNKQHTIYFKKKKDFVSDIDSITAQIFYRQRGTYVIHITCVTDKTRVAEFYVQAIPTYRTYAKTSFVVFYDECLEYTVNDIIRKIYSKLDEQAMVMSLWKTYLAEKK